MALRVARRGGDRRAAPLRRRAAGGAARQERHRRHPRRVGHDRHADPAHRGDDGLRRPRRVGARRAAPGSHPRHHALGAHPRRRRCGHRALFEAEAPVWEKVRAEVAAGRQAYVVCPLIEESEKLEVRSAEETFERLTAGTGELAGLRVGLLHGRVPMAAARRGHGGVPRRRSRRAGRHHGHRGGRRRAERDRDGHPRRRPLRHRPAAPAAGPGRARRRLELVLPGGRRYHRRRRGPARGAGALDGRLRAGRGRPRPARRGHAHGERPEGPQRPQAGLVAARPRAGSPGPARWPSSSSAPTPTSRCTPAWPRRCRSSSATSRPTSC